MLLHVLRRPEGALLSVSPLLLGAALIPGAGLVLLLGLAIASWRAGQTALVVFLAFFLFLFAVMAYAFWSAGSTRTVRCRRDGSRVEIERRGARQQTSASDVSIEVTTRTVGWQAPVRLHEVTLTAPELGEPVTIHSGLTRGAAARAAERARTHLGLS